LILRLAFGGLLAGHGAQKLFGAFGGHGLQGTGKWFESMGYSPGERWALAAGSGEFGGGMLTALGFLHPVGPIATVAPMAVAWGRVHGGKPIWVTSGGGELPATNIAIALALALLGPGKLSVDGIFGIRAHPALAALVSALVAGGTLVALTQPTPEPAAQQTSQSAASASAPAPAEVGEPLAAP
jgi:putative oxidoreductase